MQKTVGFMCCLLVGCLAMSGEVFTSSGSASTTCQWGGSEPPVPPDQTHFTLTAAGTNIDLTCPSAYFGPVVTGSAGNLSVQGGMGFGGFGNSTSFSFQSALIDALLPVGGTGQGTVQFTLTQTWQDFSEDGAGEDVATLLFDGMQAWNQMHSTFNAGCGVVCTQPKRTQLSSTNRSLTAFHFRTKERFQ